MQKGLETRLIIHDILKILKNHKSTLDQILINKVDNNFSSSDRNMIMSVVLTITASVGSDKNVLESLPSVNSSIENDSEPVIPENN